MAHQKHPKVLRPRRGCYARTEYSFIGTTCARIDTLLEELCADLAPLARVLTVIGDNDKTAIGTRQQFGSKRFAISEESWNEYDDKLLGGEYDLALVNGNHYPAARQIVFIDPAKASTLERRKDQLTDVAAIIWCPGSEDLPDFLQGAQPQVLGTLAESRVLLKSLLTEAVQKEQPPVKALILAGGKSSRMGTDKSQLRYRSGQSELDRLVGMTRQLGLETFVSVADAVSAPTTDAPLVVDRFLGLGPLGAICSAFLTDPDAAWLVLACDLPLLDQATVADLLAARDPRCFATAVKAATQPFPEPLIALYEPRCFARLLSFISLGYASPRKVLINSDVALYELTDEAPLTNANTPEERERVLAALGETL